MQASDPADALKCNCDAENVHIRWDFGDAWEAIILQGAKRGTVVKTIVSDFTEHTWLAVGASARYGTIFMFAKPSQKKQAAFMFLEKHMTDVMVAEGLNGNRAYYDL